MPIDEGTIQQMAQQKAAPMRVDESRPKSSLANPVGPDGRNVYSQGNPYVGLIEREQSYLDNPRSAPGVEGFERELRTQSNQSAEKLRGRIAGVADPLAVGREMARMDQSTRNQLAVYLSQQQQQARQNLINITQGAAGWQQQAEQSELQRQQMAMDQQRQQQAFDEQRRQFNVQQKQSNTMDWLNLGVDVARIAAPILSGGIGGLSAGALKGVLNKDTGEDAYYDAFARVGRNF